MASFCYPVFILLFLRAVGGQTVPFSDPNIQYIGRTYTSSSGAIFSWPGVSISATFSNSATISAVFSHSGSEYYFVVFIDGVQSTINIQPSASQVAYTLATGLSLSSHNVTLIRRNEASFGPTTFYGFSLASGGSLQQPFPRPDRRIEFIGDSITCGYGDLGTLGCSFSAETEDVYQSHGPIAARSLDADFMITAWSGYGLVRNYGDPNTQSAQPLPAIYPQTVGGWSNYGNWNFSRWVPQAIVINLGTNDYSTSPQPSQTQYQTAYVNFINTIKSYYAPSVPQFFLVCGPASQDYCTYAQNVAQTIGGTFINEWGYATEFGCDYHPTVAVQTHMAATEASTISSVMGWPLTSGSSSTSTGSGSGTSSPGSGALVMYDDWVEDGFQDWSWATHSLTNTNPVFSGTYSISFTLGSWVGLFFENPSGFTLASYSSLVFSVNGGSLSNVPLVVTFVDNTANTNLIGNTVSIPTAVVAGSWVTEVIPISSFGISSSTMVSGIIIQYNAASGSGVIYVDNVYLASAATTATTAATTAATIATTAATTATTAATTATTAATTATTAATTATTVATAATTAATTATTAATTASTAATTTTAATITTGSTTGTPAGFVVYDDSLENDFEDWSWAADSLTNTNPVYSGSNSISFSLDAWVGLYFHRSTGFTLSSYSNIVFYVNGGSLSNVPLVVTFVDNTASYNLIGNTVSVPTPVVAGQWVSESIPISQFGVPATTLVSGFIIQYSAASGSGVIYVDNIYLDSTATSTTGAVSSATTAATVASATTASTGSDCASSCTAACISVANVDVNSWPQDGTTVYQENLSITNLCSSATLTSLTLTATGWNPLPGAYWNLEASGNQVSLPSYITIPPNGVFSQAVYQNQGAIPTFVIAGYTFQ